MSEAHFHRRGTRHRQRHSKQGWESLQETGVFFSGFTPHYIPEFGLLVEQTLYDAGFFHATITLPKYLDPICESSGFVVEIEPRAWTVARTRARGGGRRKAIRSIMVRRLTITRYGEINEYLMRWWLTTYKHTIDAWAHGHGYPTVGEIVGTYQEPQHRGEYVLAGAREDDLRLVVPAVARDHTLLLDMIEKIPTRHL